MKARRRVSRVDIPTFDWPASTILVTNSEGSRYDTVNPFSTSPLLAAGDWKLHR